MYYYTPEENLDIVWDDSQSIFGIDVPEPTSERAGQSETSYADGGGSEKELRTRHWTTNANQDLIWYASQSTCGLDVQELMGEKVELSRILNYCES